MKKLLLSATLCMLCCTVMFSQTPIRYARQMSWETNFYRIHADTAEKYIRSGIQSIDQYLTRQPFTSWANGRPQYDELPAGNYIIISVVDNKLQAEFYCSSRLRVLPLNDQHRVQIEVRDDAGNPAASAHLWINGGEVPFRKDINGFQLSQKRPAGAIIRVAVPGDTLLMKMEELEPMHRNGWQQWWSNFSYTRMGYVITWPVRKISRMVRTPARNWFSPKRAKYSNKGYVLFNKPKYLPQDTVMYKAYVLNRKGKPYTGTLDLSITYWSQGQYITKQLGSRKPATPGAFFGEFLTGDSMVTDQNYTLAFSSKKGRRLMTGDFRIEDYLLDEVTSYRLRSAKDDYYRPDTLRFYATAKNANGMPVMDGKVTLYLLAGRIDNFYRDTSFIPDTIWKEEKVLAVDGETLFSIPASSLPDADLSIEALAEFRNSNNEIQEEKETVKFLASSRFIAVRQEGAEIIAEYMENGRSVPAKGTFSLDDEDREHEISFPFRQRINPFSSEYYFWAEDEHGKMLADELFDVQNALTPAFGRLQEKDSTGFYLQNPSRLNIHYTIFDGRKVLVNRADTAELIQWKGRLPHGRLVNVEWSHIWKGKEFRDRRGIGLLDKLLTSSISGASTIYPGQTDTVTVSVTDYKGRPAPNVNLTAVGYNSQFGNAIRVNEPPYLERFRTHRRILFPRCEMTDVGFERKFKLGEHQGWRSVFGLDTMKYYQFLFPPDGFAIASSMISDFPPQVSVHVVEKGVPQEIYMLYLDREFAWYNGTTDSSRYVFSVKPGYTQIAFRLRDRYIEIDSIYLQPFYKHDISFDIDHLPAKSRVEKRDSFYTPVEMRQIESQIWQLENDYRGNDAFVWQRDRVVKIGAASYGNLRNNWYTGHLIGPFNNYDSVQFFKPGDFDLKFRLESSYQYRLSPSVLRLQRSSVFPAERKAQLPRLPELKWVLGDTLVPPPVISYAKEVPQPAFLDPNERDLYSTSHYPGMGSIRLQLPRDTVFSYTVLMSRRPDTTILRIRSFQFSDYARVLPGIYDLVLVTRSRTYLVMQGIEVKPNGTSCFRVESSAFQSTSRIIDEIKLARRTQEEAAKARELEAQRKFREEPKEFTNLPMPKGDCGISGVVVDKKGGQPIPGATVFLKGYAVSAHTNADGVFTLRGIRAGHYILVFSSVGYAPVEKRIEIEEGTTEINGSLAIMEQHLDEVVVVGYGTQKRVSVTGAVATVRGEELTGLLMGVVGGTNVIQVRGSSTPGGNAKPLYIVNGVPMEELPPGFSMAGAKVNVLADAAATSIYGSRAQGGAIIITTEDFIPKTVRDRFQDYSFWQPNLITGRDGRVRFAVTYPDNITSWQTFVVGMDKKKRITKASAIVRSFKPLLAQLATPQFLVEGDSATFTGKIINYTKNDISVTSRLSVNGITVSAVDGLANANGAVVSRIPVTAVGTDTLKAEFTIRSSNGFADGEIRNIPMTKRGTWESAGTFWVLENDSVVTFRPAANAGPVQIHARNNTLDVLLDEVKYLSDYPYYCMEQTASKVTGLLAEKQLRALLGQKFQGERELNRLIKRLQTKQLFDGGWSWWEEGSASLAITNYVTRALLPLKNDALTATNIRNAVLYLQNRLQYMRRPELIETLYTLAEAGHEMDFPHYLKKLDFDSLTVHQQWQVVRILQLTGQEHQSELAKLVAARSGSMPGSVYWGREKYYWQDNAMATTALAFRVLSEEPEYSSYLPRITQYFFEKRKGGHWVNTVESATTLATILPYITARNSEVTAPARLIIEGDSTRDVKRFPYNATLGNQARELAFRRSGGGLLYLSASQEFFNPDPSPVDSQFRINSWFERSGTKISALTGGQRAIMKVTVEALSDAEYVMLEIPIPAGCTYVEKKQAGWGMHTEFLKNKMVIFIEKMDKGTYRFEAELEPRYEGSYHLNPVKAGLMYFPIFYGRNEMKKVKIN